MNNKKNKKRPPTIFKRKEFPFFIWEHLNKISPSTTNATMILNADSESWENLEYNCFNTHEESCNEADVISIFNFFFFFFNSIFSKLLYKFENDTVWVLQQFDSKFYGAHFELSIFCIGFMVLGEKGNELFWEAVVEPACICDINICSAFNQIL